MHSHAIHRQGPHSWFAGMSGHRRGRGPRGFGGPGWGPGPGPGGHGFGRHGRRRPRGDVRAAILLLLDEEPRNGYAVMQEIEERSAGAWRPSPGSVYPVLQQLEDEGLVEAQESGERKVVALTEAGRKYVEENRESLGAPWEAAAAGFSEDMLELRNLIWQVGSAVHQLVASGDEAQQKRAREVLTETRRDLYRILAGDDTHSR
jgi:DNA-binding PadR family transcriptional regulator